MYPKEHLTYGIIFAVLLLFLLPIVNFIGFIIILLSTIFIDVDHYLVYVKRKKDYNLKKAFNYWDSFRIKYENRKNIKSPLTIFHTIEFLLVIFILSFYKVIFLYVALGLFFHIFLDVIDMASRNKLERRQYSLILNTFLRNKKFKYI